MKCSSSGRSAIRSAVAWMSLSVAAVMGDGVVNPATAPAVPATMPAASSTQPVGTATQPATGPTTAPSTSPSAQISLNFKDVPVDAVLDYLSDSAGYVVVKESPIEGRITVVSKKPLTPDEAITVLNAVLKSTGHTAMANGRVLRISAREKAKKGNIPVHVGADPAEISPGDELITQVLPIVNVDAARLRRELTPLMPLDADVTASESTNAIVITDSSSNIRRLAYIIAALDVREAASMDIKLFHLKNANATQAAKLLGGMFKGDAGGMNQQQQQMMEMQMRGGGQPQPMPMPEGGRSGKIPGGAVEQAMRARINTVADERTNTLFVTAPVEVLKLIETILKDLDSNPAPTSQLRAFTLKFAEAEPTAKLLSNLIKGEESRRGFDDYPFYQRFPSGDATKPKVSVSHDDRTNTVIVSAPADVLLEVEALIKTLDANPAATSEVKVFALKHADAWTTAKLVRQTFAPEDKDKSDNPMRFFIFGMGNASSQKGAKVTVSSDDRTNSVVVTGPTEMMKAVETLIAQIDNNPVSEESMFIYRLRNGQSARLEIVLNTLFGNYDSRGGQGQNGQQGNPDQQQQQQQMQANGGGDRSQRDGSGGTGIGSRRSNRDRSGRQQGGGGQLSAGMAHAVTEMAGQVFIVADRDTNSLVVTTASKYQERVKQIITELDRPVPQVLIKVLVAEVTHDDSADLGLDFSILNRRPNGQGNTISSNLGNASQTTGLVISMLEDKLNVTLHALATTGKLDVLSRPYILASDNQLASITVGNEVPFITNTRITDTGQQINTIQYQDVGIILNVTPHINPDGLVIMDVSPEISQLTGTTVPISAGVSAPVIAKRSAESRVGVKTGQTIVIGGLMEDRKTSTVLKIPLLGDIPLVGAIFSRTQVTKSKTELLIFLTPHVAQQPDLLQDATEQEKQGLQLAPKAVGPGKFDEHLNGLDRGAMPFTRPSDAERSIHPIGPATQPQ